MQAASWGAFAYQGELGQHRSDDLSQPAIQAMGAVPGAGNCCEINQKVTDGFVESVDVQRFEQVFFDYLSKVRYHDNKAALMP